MWFTISGLIVADRASPASLIRGFTFGIDFEGGTKVSLPVAGAHGTATTQQVEDVFTKTLGKDPRVGRQPSARAARRRCRSAPRRCRTTKSTSCAPRCSTRSSRRAQTDSPASWRSATPGSRRRWGGQITKKALIALVVFLVLAAIYIAVRYERVHGGRSAGRAGLRPSSAPPGSTRWSDSRSPRAP